MECKKCSEWNDPVHVETTSRIEGQEFDIVGQKMNFECSECGHRWIIYDGKRIYKHEPC